MSTADWLSSAVLKVSERRAGMVVFRSMTLVIRPPIVSTPSDRGVTSKRRTSLTSPFKMAAWTAAPMATTSSGLTVMLGSLPPVSRRTRVWTEGRRVEPPTRMTSSMSASVTLASCMACCTGSVAAIDQVSGDLVEGRAHDGRDQVLRSAGIGGHKREVNLGLGYRRELDLGLLGRLEQPLERLRVVSQVDAGVGLELGGEMVDESPVEVVTTEMGVARGGPHLDHAVAHIEDAHVKGATAEVEDQDGFVRLLVEAVGQGGRRRLVDDPHDLDPGDPAGIGGGLALRIVEVGGNGDDRLRHLFTEELAGVLGQLAQDEGRDLLGGILLASHIESRHAVRTTDYVE